MNIFLSLDLDQYLFSGELYFYEEGARQMHAEPLTEVSMVQVLQGYQNDAPLGMS